MDLGFLLALCRCNGLHALCQAKSAEIGAFAAAASPPSAIPAGRSLPGTEF